MRKSPKTDPRDIVQTGIRLPVGLIRALQREASRHRISFNREVQMRLEDSLEKKDAPRAFDAIQEDMRVVWERYSNRLLMLDLEEELVRALAQSTDIKVVAFANSWLIHRERARDLDLEHKQMPEPSKARAESLSITREELNALMRAAAPKLGSVKRRPKGGVS